VNIPPALRAGGIAAFDVPAAGQHRGRLFRTGDTVLYERLCGRDGSGRLAAGVPVEPADLPGPVGAGDLILLLSRGYDPDRMGLVARLRSHGLSWLPVVFAEGHASIGPLDGPRWAATVDDLVLRRTAAAERPERLAGPGGDGIDSWDDAAWAWIAAAVALEVGRYLTGEAGRCAEHEVVLNPYAMGVNRHRVVPVPLDDPDRGTWPARERLRLTVGDLVDPRVGVVTRLRRIRHHRSIPRQLITVQASVTNMRRISPWLTDPVTAGCSFDSEDAARRTAVGEAAERYSGEIVQRERLRFASWDELTADGEHAVDPETLVLFSDRQYATKGFPFVPLTRRLRVHWVPGRYLTGDRPAWLPASLVYPNWYTGGFEHDPHTNNPFYPGLAAGPDLDFALAAGIQEVIERDATMVWWSNAHRLPGVTPSLAMRALWEGPPTEHGQRAWLVHLDNEFGVPVMAGMVENTTERLFTMGFAARPDPAAAAFKAWAEALTLQDMARDLLRPEGGYRRAAGKGDVNDEFVKPVRADRRYLDDYRTDLRDVVDLMCQMQIYLDPRAVERVRPWVDVPAERDLACLPRLPDGTLATYRSVVESRGYGIYYADVTTKDVAATGMRVVRVLIPGLAPNFASAFPFQGRGRLRQAAVALGWRDTPLAEHEINLFPLAHA
jgi:ribosomal protein S12 methylthiotransferase accessory factor